MMDKDSLKKIILDIRNSKKTVVDLIKRSCSLEEVEASNLRYPILIGDNGSHQFYIPDLYLEEGCKKLGFPPKSIIEVRGRIAPDTLLRMSILYDEIQKTLGKEYHFVLIIYSSDKQLLDERFRSRIFHRRLNFHIFSYKALLKKSLFKKSVELSKDDKDILHDAYRAFQHGPNTFFLGSGVSKSASIPTWDELLKGLLEGIYKNGGKINKENYDDLFEESGYSSIILGRMIQSYFKDKYEFNEAIHNVLYKKDHYESPLIDAICNVIQKSQNVLREVITYNYDDLIEQKLSALEVRNYSVYENNAPDISFPVYHVHGILTQHTDISANVVLSEKEYHEKYLRSFDWSNVEQLHALQRSNCFFIGLSMNDPNLRRLLDIAHQGDENDNGTNRHYALLCTRDIINICDKKKTVDDNTIKEYIDLKERTLADLGVSIIWFDDYPDLPQIIQYLSDGDETLLKKSRFK